MVKEDLVHGLLHATQKGESLEKAMMSFYSAGYSKEDIEEAAKEVVRIKSHPTQIQQPIKKEKKSFFKKKKTEAKPAIKPQVQKKPESVQPVAQKVLPNNSTTKPVAPPIAQKVSKYEGKSLKSKRLLIEILIVVIFLILAGIVGLIFYGDLILDKFLN